MRAHRLPFPRVSTLIVAIFVVAGCGCSGEAKSARLLDRAERYFKSGEYDKAKIEYLNVLKSDRQNATAIQQLGIIWFEGGAPLHALPFLLKTRELAPNNLNARMKLALAFMSLGNAAEARKEAIAILDQSPAHDEALVLLVDASRTQEDLADTEQRLQKLNQQDKASFHLAWAHLFLRKKDQASAESAIQRALALDPKSPSTHLAVAGLHWSKNNLTEADKEFKTASELAPVRSAARLKYTEFKMRTRAEDEAAASLKEITRQAPDFLPAWARLAQIAFGNKKYDESLALLENVFSRDPVNLEARVLEGEVLLAKGDGKKALEKLDRLNKTYPKSSVIKYVLARAYLENKNPSQATAALNEAVTLSPEFSEAILLLGQVNLRMGNVQPVVAAMESLLKKRPGLIPAQLLLADAYRSLGRLDEAVAIFRQHIAASPKNPQAYFWLGAILRQQNKFDEARKHFEKARELAPDDLTVLSQIVDLDLKEKNFDQALQRVQEQINRTPAAAGAHFLQGKIYAAQNELDRAEAALSKTVDLDPNFSSAYDLLITTYLAANKMTQAIGQLEGLLAKNPDNERALMLSAMIYEKMNEVPKARDAYEKLLTKRPDFVPALNNLAYLYAEQLNQPDKAYDLARKARESQPGDAAIADTLGWVHYKRGEYQQAVTLLQESAGKLGNVPELQFHLGMAHYMMGQTEAARIALRQAVDAPSHFQGKEDARRRLAMLGEGSGKPAELSTNEVEKMVKQHPNDPIAQTRLGESYERAGEWAKAGAAYEQAFKLNPKLLSTATKLAQLNAGPLQNRDKALEFAKKARDLAPSDPQVAGILGGIAYRTGNFTWAYSLLQESVRQRTNDVAILHDLAWAAYSLGKVSEAEQAMQRVLSASSDSAQAKDAKSFLAMTALDQNRKELAAAESEINKILATDPTYVPALMARAAIQQQRGESKMAAGGYTEILRRFPDFAPAQKRLASLYAEDPEKLGEAYDLAMKARKSLPDDPESAQILAMISYRKKDFSYAVRLLEESAKRTPLNARNLYYLGMSRLQLNDAPRSRDALKRALAEGLSEPLAAEAKRVLAELDKK